VADLYGLPVLDGPQPSSQEQRGPLSAAG
jgi:hypothetical protein